MDCDEYISIQFLSSNNGLPVIISGIKTSAGKVKWKGLNYYINNYVKEKRGKVKEWLEKASRNYPSVLEHWVLTYYISGCSRNCTHQLVRHRLASYTQESQRYSIAVDKIDIDYESMSESEYLSRLLDYLDKAEKSLNDLKANNVLYISDLERVTSIISQLVVIPPYIKGYNRLEYLLSVVGSLKTYVNLVLSGVPYEDARYVLPSSIRTRIVVTANLREWIHIIKLRTSRHAQWEIRCVMNMIKEDMVNRFPELEGVLGGNP